MRWLLAVLALAGCKDHTFDVQDATFKLAVQGFADPSFTGVGECRKFEALDMNSFEPGAMPTQVRGTICKSDGYAAQKLKVVPVPKELTGEPERGG